MYEVVIDEAEPSDANTTSAGVVMMGNNILKAEKHLHEAAQSTDAVWTELPHMGTFKRGGVVLPAFVDWKAQVKSWS